MLLPAQLVAPQFLTNADAVYYTVPPTATGQAATTAKIARAVFVNTTGGAVTLTVAIVAAGGSVSSGNTVINALSIPANQTYTSQALAGAILPAGTTLHASAGSNTAIQIMVSGLTFQ